MNFFVAEIIGTALLMIFGCGVVATASLAGSKGEGSGWIVITTGWGLGVAVAVYSVFEFSSAHINPAVTVGARREWRVCVVSSPCLYPGATHRRLYRRGGGVGGV